MEGVEMDSGIDKEDVTAVSFLGKTSLSITLKFKDVVYTIKKPKTKFPYNLGNPCISQGHEKADKLILKGVTGSVHPGEMLAMLGPSGSGKTTLLTALGGRLTHRRGRLDGTVLYNGKPLHNAVNRSIGFVAQDDVLYPHLTVAETLIYTAHLRLPKTLTRSEKDLHAASVIEQLGLDRCKDSLVGGQLVRGVSGGERKRVSIGQEMLINPGLIFLDEPTSGLDSTTAQTIVSTLAKMVAGGRTVVMTIHQPSSRLFYMFDKVMLLSDGHPVYFGKGSEALSYFSRVGYAPLVAMNPSDFLLDLANGVSPNGSEEDKTRVMMSLVEAYNVHQSDKLSREVCEADGNNRKTDVDVGDHKRTEQIRYSNWFLRFVVLLWRGVMDWVGMGDKNSEQWCTTWFQQFEVLLRRGVRERKHETFSSLRVTQVVVVAALCIVLWWHSKPDQVQDQTGLLFFYSSFWAFYPVFEAVFTFPQERLMLTKERASGMYRLTSYFMARTAGDMPMDLVLPTLFITCSYWASGLRSQPGPFFITLAVVLLSVIAAQGLGLAIGANIKNLKAATTLAAVVLLASVLVSGFYVHDVPVIVSWIKYLSFNYYTYKLLLAAQFSENQTYHCGGSATCFVKDYPTVKVAGIGDKTASFTALFAMIIGYRIIAYVALVRVGAKRS